MISSYHKSIRLLGPTPIIRLIRDAVGFCVRDLVRGWFWSDYGCWRAFEGATSVLSVVFRWFFGVEARFEAYLSAGRCFRALGWHQSLRIIRLLGVSRTAGRGFDIVSGSLGRTPETPLNSIVPELHIWRATATCPGYSGCETARLWPS